MAVERRTSEVGHSSTTVYRHEILVLRHQIALLRRQLGDTKVRFSPTDRVLLAALLHRLPHQTFHRLRLLVPVLEVDLDLKRSQPLQRLQAVRRLDRIAEQVVDAGGEPGLEAGQTKRNRAVRRRVSGIPAVRRSYATPGRSSLRSSAKWRWA
ncbi:hypothetical protein [Kibdelosporangium philippinense]|uniref:hypothetical protein n=1 Tax=Kibdelosporangium philippinense TaxID=211113 RepID=UPI00361B0F85